jgi:hypothetical protein
MEGEREWEARGEGHTSARGSIRAGGAHRGHNVFCRSNRETYYYAAVLRAQRLIVCTRLGAVWRGRGCGGGRRVSVCVVSWCPFPGGGGGLCVGQFPLIRQRPASSLSESCEQRTATPCAQSPFTHFNPLTHLAPSPSALPQALPRIRSARNYHHPLPARHSSRPPCPQAARTPPCLSEPPQQHKISPTPAPAKSRRIQQSAVAIHQTTRTCIARLRDLLTDPSTLGCMGPTAALRA